MSWIDLVPTNAGAVLKRVTKPGSDETKPEKEQLVSVHYTGRLNDEDGVEFDSSLELGEAYSKPLTFPVGVGKVVPGFDLAVLSMSVGEECVVKLSPAFGYGDEAVEGSGMRPTIPPGSTLVFELKLVALGEAAEKQANADDESKSAKAKERAQADQDRLATIRAQRAEQQKAAAEAKAEKKAAEAEAKMKKKKKGKKGKKDDAAAAGAPLDSKAAKKMKPKDLKKELKARGLSTQGNKKELLARLLESLTL